MSDIATALVNGQVTDYVSIADRGLAYGDGVFETIAVADGKPCLWKKHTDRLIYGCKQLGIVFNNLDELEKEVFTLSRNAQSNGVIKIIITRGVGASGYKTQPSAKPSRIALLQHRQTFSEQLYRNGVDVCFCKQRLGYNPTLSKIKHLCRLEQVLARMEWQDEYHEGIMFDYYNNAIEGTMSNLFIISDNVLKTPKLDNCGIQGVMREWILEQCQRHNIAVKQQTIDRQAILEADGLFFCNALIRVWPVRSIEANSYDVAVVHRLLRSFAFSEVGIAL
ncbi:MAG: aminodeoxychorismate lyase [Chromatiales bacterium]|nr:aminodeoxychorismate lyase [Chromatiales bacterium]